MINLDKNTSNTVVLTLTERSKLINPTYVFRFVNALEKNEVIFNAEDLSNFNCRYNLFNIVESGSTFTNLTGGTINLNPAGYWDYQVYEATGSTLSISGTTGRILETGKMFLNDDNFSDDLPIYK
jgi:hypothetical protein